MSTSEITMNSGKTSQTVFFGSGPVASACLERLAQHTPIEIVITKPRPAHHRGSVPVLELAEKLGLPTLTAANKKELDILVSQHSFSSEYAVLIDFGIIVSSKVIDTFKYGIINSHFSLLPKLRGADPITWAIANGDKETGVSLMLIDEGMDTGQLIAQEPLAISNDDTTPSLTDKLIVLSDHLIQRHVAHYLSGAITPYPQPQSDQATYSRKLTKQDGVIDTSQPAHIVEQKIRAFLEWPQSRTTLGSVDVIITKAHVSEQETVISVRCGDDNFLAIDTLKPLGKKEMPVAAFLAGYKNRI